MDGHARDVLRQRQPHNRSTGEQLSCAANLTFERRLAVSCFRDRSGQMLPQVEPSFFRMIRLARPEHRLVFAVHPRACHSPYGTGICRTTMQHQPFRPCPGTVKLSLGRSASSFVRRVGLSLVAGPMAWLRILCRFVTTVGFQTCPALLSGRFFRWPRVCSRLRERVRSFALLRLPCRSLCRPLCQPR